MPKSIFADLSCFGGAYPCDYCVSDPGPPSCHRYAVEGQPMGAACPCGEHSSIEAERREAAVEAIAAALKPKKAPMKKKQE